MSHPDDRSGKDPDDYVSVPDKTVRKLACIEESVERLRGLLKEYEEHAAPYWRAEIERLEAECHRWKHHAEQRLIALREVEAELRAALAGKEPQS